MDPSPKRLQIARNLATGRRLVFMDEPTGGLDVSVQARLLDLLRGVVREMDLIDQVLDDPQHGYRQLLVSSVLQGGRGRCPRRAMRDSPGIFGAR